MSSMPANTASTVKCRLNKQRGQSHFQRRSAKCPYPPFQAARNSPPASRDVSKNGLKTLPPDDIEQDQGGPGRPFNPALHLRHITDRDIDIVSKGALAQAKTLAQGPDFGGDNASLFTWTSTWRRVILAWVGPSMTPRRNMSSPISRRASCIGLGFVFFVMIHLDLDYGAVLFERFKLFIRGPQPAAMEAGQFFAVQAA
jgi:hypothetical protein